MRASKTRVSCKSTLTNRIANYLAEHNRRLVGWNEALNDGLHPDAVIQYWLRNKSGVIEAIQQGRQVIISPFFTYYLDRSYSVASLKKVYNHKPIFDELDAESAQNIIGIEAPLWCEWVPNPARLEYQVFPRLVAFAERAWIDPSQASYDDFERRMSHFKLYLDAMGIRYAPDSAVNPSRIKQLLGVLTLLQAQRDTR